MNDLIFIFYLGFLQTTIEYIPCKRKPQTNETNQFFTFFFYSFNWQNWLLLNIGREKLGIILRYSLYNLEAVRFIYLKVYLKVNGGKYKPFLKDKKRNAYRNTVQLQPIKFFSFSTRLTSRWKTLSSWQNQLKSLFDGCDLYEAGSVFTDPTQASRKRELFIHFSQSEFAFLFYFSMFSHLVVWKVSHGVSTCFIRPLEYYNIKST